MQVIVAIALICGEIVCGNVIYEPRFADMETCHGYLGQARFDRRANEEQVVLDDSIWTTEEKIKEFNK